MPMVNMVEEKKMFQKQPSPPPPSQQQPVAVAAVTATITNSDVMPTRHATSEHLLLMDAAVELEPQPVRLKHRSKQSLNGPRRVDPSDGRRMRAAAVCLSDDRTQVLLVTSLRHEARWVIPGGGMEDGETSTAAVKRELLEEAGVLAQVEDHVGVFVENNRKIKTHVFIMRVTEELTSWAEKLYGRQRRWFAVDQALTELKPTQKQYLAHCTCRPPPDDTPCAFVKHQVVCETSSSPPAAAVSDSSSS